MKTSFNKVMYLSAWIIFFALATSQRAVALSEIATGRPSSDNLSELTPSTPSTSSTPSTPAWLEPRGINVVELVGVLPEEVLRDSIISYDPDRGVVRYLSGERIGDQVTVRVRYDYGFKNELGCFGQTPNWDHSTTISPPGKMRVFDNGTDVTNRVSLNGTYFPAGQITPQYSAATMERYQSRPIVLQRDSGGWLNIPANMGCVLKITGAMPTQVTAEFRFQSADYIKATLVHQDELQAHSYIGEGYAEKLQSLQKQMSARYRPRHDEWQWFFQPLEIKQKLQGADYAFVKFPPSGFNPYGEGMAPSAGAYRFGYADGDTGITRASVDNFNTMLVPFRYQWQDADQNPNSRFLNYYQLFDKMEGYRFDGIKSPEYFLPPGVEYHPCMTNGGCSADLLQKIYDTTYPLNLYFYKIERKTGGLQQIPLRAVGNTYTATTASATSDPEGTFAHSALMAPPTVVNGGGYSTYLPLIIKPLPPAEPDDPTMGCPCGWFDQEGRMWDFIP